MFDRPSDVNRTLQHSKAWPVIKRQNTFIGAANGVALGMTLKAMYLLVKAWTITYR
jgi:hypothetical protein